MRAIICRELLRKWNPYFSEIPQELGDFGVLIHAGFSRERALIFNFLSGLLAVVGAIISLLASQHIVSFSKLMLPFTAGGFIYIAGCDLLPELQRKQTVKIRSAVRRFDIRYRSYVPLNADWIDLWR